MGNGIKTLCKIYGGIKFTVDGKTTEYVWDYTQDRARLKSEMDAERYTFSEKAQHERMKRELFKKKQEKLF